MTNVTKWEKLISWFFFRMLERYLKKINSHINLKCFRTLMQETSFSNRFIIFIIALMLCCLLPPTWRRCHTKLSDIICLAVEILAWYCVENERNQLCVADILPPSAASNGYSSCVAPQRWLHYSRWMLSCLLGYVCNRFLGIKDTGWISNGTFCIAGWHIGDSFI